MALFISFEGPDGSGKSTQARLLASALRDRGFAVTETREPGGTSVGEQIRDVLLGKNAPPSTPLTMALLLSAARSQLVSEVIRPALAAGNMVIADRFADSTAAYQSFGLGLDLTTVRDLETIATRGVRPDLTLYIDAPADVALARVSKRTERNRMDDETVGFHERVREGYLQLLQADRDRWAYIDGTASVEAVHEGVMRVVDARLGRLEPVP